MPQRPARPSTRRPRPGDGRRRSSPRSGPGPGRNLAAAERLVERLSGRLEQAEYEQLEVLGALWNARRSAVRLALAGFSIAWAVPARPRTSFARSPAAEARTPPNGCC